MRIGSKRVRLGELLREHREARGLTQNKVADMIGVSRVTYNGLETGKRRVKLEVFGKACKAIGCDAAALMRDVGYTFTEEGDE